SAIRPAYVSDLVPLAEQSAFQGNAALAMRAARLAADLYPGSDAANGILGVVTVMAGDVSAGESLLRKSASIRRDGYARASNLARIAGVMARTGDRRAAIALLEVALRLDPSSKEAQAGLAAMR